MAFQFVKKPQQQGGAACAGKIRRRGEGGRAFFAYFCSASGREVLDPAKRRHLVCNVCALPPYRPSQFWSSWPRASPCSCRSGFAGPVGWHAMLAGPAHGGRVRLHLSVQFRNCGQKRRRRLAGRRQALNSIRRLVALNLVLGICTVVAAISAR
jgi:hypothetical protein